MSRLIIAVFILLNVTLIFAMSVSAQTEQQMDVSATVPPTAAEGSLILSSSRSSTTVLAAGDEVVYTIKYRSQSSESWPFVVTASWTTGLLEGTSSTYVDAIEYKINSATTTDNSVTPQIDLQNKTITWDISSLASSSSYHEVQFTLKVKSDSPAGQRSTATVSVNGSLNSVTLTGQSQNAVVEEPTIKPTATPSIVISETSPTPSFLRVQLFRISSTNAVINLVTDLETIYTIRYGESVNSMDTVITSLDFSTVRDFPLEHLKADTTYYFRLNIQAKDGKRTASDIFTFKTAKSADLFGSNLESVMISSSNLLLSSKSPEGASTQGVSNIIITPHTPLTISITVNHPENISSIVIKMQNARILGIATYASEPPIQEVKLLELFPGIFSGELRAPTPLGEYRLVTETRYKDGSYSIETLPNKIYVSHPLRVVNGQNNKPIEKVFVTFKKKVDRENIFVPLESSLSYKFTTDTDGYLNIILPAGIYEVSISAIGYRKTTTTINLENLEKYPIIPLQPSITLKETAIYYYDTIGDSLDFITRNASLFFLSQRSQDASLVLIVLAVFFCGMLMLSIRLHTNIIGIPVWTVEHTLDHLRRFFHIGDLKKHIIVYEGDNYHKSLSGVRIVIMDKNNHSILSAKTDLVGKTTISEKVYDKLQFPLTVFTYRKSFSSYPTRLEKTSTRFEYINLFMKKNEPKKNDLFAFVHWYIDLTMIIVSDLFLLGVIGFTICFTLFQGIISSFPYLTVSVLLIVFWLVYLHQIWKFQRKENRYTP